ncbi:hypothetical protein HETIRDRAFT_451806 [Heterobasidion irregulare TC 32-1]|uniref:Uncharacterized protein n=1 Tax=Heterobasidion irregulare (strain TC 32-1) TaxID=747525 RepID=W4K904_HETIT|nr:uncharacterized protein HETIRDRAFT_451806 [Heterobasidion irregulare TC 32-1]ETW82239.1 hypothetical protein HETIRDRAFT_451806 [Heterobasidion irregulare TC 32-1]
MPSAFFPARPAGFESPSIAIEKGAHRLAHPPQRPSSRSRARVRTQSPSHRTTSSTASVTTRASMQYERRMASLVVLLAIAATASFAAAWMLFLTGNRVTHHLDTPVASRSPFQPPTHKYAAVKKRGESGFRCRALTDH